MFWLGLIVSLCYVPGITGAYIATQWPVLSFVLPFGLFRRGSFTVFHLLGVLFVAYVLAWLPWNPNVYSGVYGAWLVIIAALSVWWGTTMTSTRELYQGLAIGAAVSSLVAVFQHFGIGVVPTTSTAPAGLYVNSVQQGTVLALLMIALATERLWWWILPLVPGFLLSESRGGVIILVVGALGYFFRSLWASVGVVMIALPVYLLWPHPEPDANRMYIWQVAWDNLTWFGWGAGVFFDTLMFKDNVPFFPEYVHNDFLQLMFEHGLGAIFPIAVLGYAAWRSDAREWPIVLAFCTAACFSMPFFIPVTSFLAFVAVGRILREHGLHVNDGYASGWAVLLGLWNRRTTRRQGVPLVSLNTAEG